MSAALFPATLTGVLPSVPVFLILAALLVVFVGPIVFAVVCVVDMARRPEWQWRLAHQEQVAWLLLVVVLNFLAVLPLIYWLAIRPKLRRVEHDVAAGLYGPWPYVPAGWATGPAAVGYPSAPVPPPAPVSPSASRLPPAGWYPDPSDATGLRWWDGAQWGMAAADYHAQATVVPTDEVAGVGPSGTVLPGPGAPAPVVSSLDDPARVWQSAPPVDGVPSGDGDRLGPAGPGSPPGSPAEGLPALVLPAEAAPGDAEPGEVEP